MRRAVFIPWVLLLGCGSSPNPDFYTLYPEPGSPSRAALQVELRRPGLPGYLDRPNMVRRAHAGRLEISGTERWGSDLGEIVGATLARNLTQRLPDSTVYTESGVISGQPDLIVEIDLQQFEPTADGGVRLDAQVALHWTGGSKAVLIKRYALAKTPETDDTEGKVAAMSLLLAELSDAVARSIAATVPARGGRGNEPHAGMGEPSP